LDEAIDVCRRLWTEATVAHQGEFFQFPAVAFEPKPVQSPLPISIGGESTQALRRAVRLAEGWMGMAHTPETAAQQVAVIRRLDAEAGREAPPVRVTVVGELSSEQPPSAWADAGVDRLIVHPWARTRDAVGALTTLADQYLS
jgi:alkanesulfonate monooxygenase SsuD/methylene tetrahydromethanopterin reductase-like flavin-dependent oxidoreductase (luciferase family)